jgi:mono/diheme cytochrome c family protein
MLPVLSGCSHPDETDTSQLKNVNVRSVDESVLADGERAYNMYCAGCHSEDGNGNGASAGFMHPRPRNFQEARFKFSSTRAGRLPRDEDLKRTIRNGLRGSAMPAWPLLPEQTVDSLVAYIKTFSDEWDRRPAAEIPVVDDPYRSKEDKSEAIARGEVIYHGFATCWTCHPAYVSESRLNEHLVAMDNPPRPSFRPGLTESEKKVNAAGEMTYPPDFKRDHVRGGMSVDDLYRSIAAGITGTAMPTWVDSIAYHDSNGAIISRPDDIWAMAYYVQDLIRQKPSKMQPGSFVVRDRTQKLYFDGEIPPPIELAEESESDEEFTEDDE